MHGTRDPQVLKDISTAITVLFPTVKYLGSNSRGTTDFNDQYSLENIEMN